MHGTSEKLPLAATDVSEMMGDMGSGAKKSPRTGSRMSPSSWAAVGLGAGIIGTGVITGLASLFARAVVTPSRTNADEVRILGVGRDHIGEYVDLQTRDPQATTPGRYSLWFNNQSGHAKIGDIISTPSGTHVRRRIISIDRGDLAHATHGSIGGNYFINPTDAGVLATDVHVPLTAGPAPAWLAEGDQHADTWAILIHGRGATRLETLRGLKPLSELGLTVLSMSYRNDGEGPEVNNGRYGLGATEWHDVDAAIGYALSQGARDVVLVGWSMGGAIALRTLELSRFRHRIRALALTGPAVDWFEILRYQAKINNIPYLSGRIGGWMLGQPIGKKLTGLTAPIDLNALNWVERAGNIKTPVLIQHSRDDGFVPFVSSERLAKKNPRYVTLVPFTRAGHVREWNVDPQKWETTLKDWMRATLKI